MHQPKGNDEWRAAVQAAASTAMGKAMLLTCAVCVQIDARWTRPASHRTPKGLLRASAPASRTQKPDLDNLAKGVLDSLNGVVWRDDAQVVMLTVSKRWCDADEPAGTFVRVSVVGSRTPDPRTAEATMINNDNRYADFFAALRAKLDAGAKQYGDASFARPTAEILGELAAEALDLAGWGFVLWERIRRLQAARKDEA